MSVNIKDIKNKSVSSSSNPFDEWEKNKKEQAKPDDKTDNVTNVTTSNPFDEYLKKKSGTEGGTETSNILSQDAKTTSPVEDKNDNYFTDNLNGWRMRGRDAATEKKQEEDAAKLGGSETSLSTARKQGGLASFKKSNKIFTPNGVELKLDTKKTTDPLQAHNDNISALQERINTGTTTPDDIQKVSALTNKTPEAVGEYLVGNTTKGAAIDNVDEQKKLRSDLTNVVNRYNESTGSNYVPDEILGSADKTTEFIQKVKQQKANDIKKGFDLQQRMAIEPDNPLLKEQDAAAMGAGLDPESFLNKANHYQELLKKHVVNQTILENESSGKSKDQTIKDIARRLDPREYYRSIAAKIQAVPTPLNDVEMAGQLYDKIFGTKEKDDLLNSQLGVAEFAYNNQQKDIANNQIAQGILNEDNNLVNMGKARMNATQSTDEIYQNYPSLLKRKIVQDISKELAFKAGQLDENEGEVVGGTNNDRGLRWFGANLPDIISTEAFKKYHDDPKSKDITEKLLETTDLFSDASYMGGMVDSYMQPFKELFHSVGDISGFRSNKDVYSDKIKGELFPTDTPNTKSDFTVLGHPFKVRTALNTTANLTGMVTIAAATEGIAGNLGAAQNVSKSLSAYTSFGLPSYDAALKESYNFLYSDAARTLYATITAVTNAEGGRFLDLGKVIRIPGVNENFAKIAEGISKEDISKKAVKELLDESKNAYIDFAVKYGKNVNKGAATMAYFNISNNIEKIAFGDPNTKPEDILPQAGHAFMDGVLGMSIMGAFGAASDVKNEKNSSYKGFIYDMAVNHDATKDVFETGLRNGTYNQEQYNEKIQILNTAKAAKNAMDLAQQETNISLDQNQKSVYVANKTAESVLREKAASKAVPEEQQAKYLEQADRLREQSTQTLDGLKFTPTLEPLYDIYHAEKQYDQALENFNTKRGSEEELTLAKDNYDALVNRYFSEDYNKRADEIKEQDRQRSEKKKQDDFDNEFNKYQSDSDNAKKDSEIKPTFEKVKEFIPAEKATKAQGIIDKVNNAENINEKDINDAQDILYDALDKNPESAHLIEPLITKLQDYEFTTKTETNTVTEREPIEGAYANKSRKVIKPALEQSSGATAEIKRADGTVSEGILNIRNGQYVLDVDKSEPIVIGEKAITDRDLKLPSEEREPEPIKFDADGNVESVTFENRNGDLITVKGHEKVIDIAIQLQADAIGKVPDEVFDKAYETVIKEVPIEVLKNKPSTEKVESKEDISSSTKPINNGNEKNGENANGKESPTKQSEQGSKEQNGESGKGSSQEQDVLKKEGQSTTEGTAAPLKEGGNVGVSHERINKIADKLGLPKIERGNVLSPEEYAKRGRLLIENGVDPLEVAKQFKEDGLVNADRISIVRAQLEKYVKEADKLGKEKGFGSKEYKDAKEKVDEFSRDVVKPMGTEFGATGRSLQGERDLDTDSFTTVSRQVTDLTGQPLSKYQGEKIEELTSKNQKLQSQVKDLEAKLIDATNEAIGETKSEPTKEKDSATVKSKKVADKLRQAKIHKPDSFSAGTPVSVIWDTAVEVVAKSIETGGKLADAINDGIKYIKNTDWYKSLSEDKQLQAENDFRDWHISEANDTEKLKTLQEKFLSKTGNKFSIDEAKSIWDYAKKTYLDNGIPYTDMIGKVANDLGLSWRQISEAITSPKVERASDEMWKKRGDLVKNQNATRRWIEDQDKSTAGKVLRKISGGFRGVAVFGHGGIFVGTHAGMNLFSPTSWNKIIPAFINGYKFAYGKEAAYNRSMAELKNDHNYVLAQRSGLRNNPDQFNAEEYQKSQHFLGKLGTVGERGFNAIKVLRQQLFNYHYDKLSPVEKEDKMSAVSVAKLVNLATGATNLKIPEWINEATFAGGMEAARWGKLTRSPVEATTTALKAIFTPSKATIEEKVFAKVWARRVGEQLATFTSLLLANAAIQNTINPSNKVNITNPDKSDFLKFKFGDLNIDPTSGMRGVASFMYGLGEIPFQNSKELRGDTRLEEAGKKTFGYGRGKLAPLYSTLVDLFTKTDYYGNPLPFSNDKATGSRHKLTWGEYLWQKAPLPAAEAAHETYKAMNEDQSNKVALKHVMEGVFMGVLSGGTGFRIGESEGQPHGITDQDKKDPTFKYFIDKGMTLPNVPNSSEKIKNNKDNTIKTISDFPQEIQDKYNKIHTKELKNELQKVKDKGTVYLVTYTDSKGQKEDEISFNFKPNGANKKLDELNKDQLSQVLSLAQKEATRKAKKEVFKDTTSSN